MMLARMGTIVHDDIWTAHIQQELEHGEFQLNVTSDGWSTIIDTDSVVIDNLAHLKSVEYQPQVVRRGHGCHD